MMCLIVYVYIHIPVRRFFGWEGPGDPGRPRNDGLVEADEKIAFASEASVIRAATTGWRRFRVAAPYYGDYAGAARASEQSVFRPKLRDVSRDRGVSRVKFCGSDLSAELCGCAPPSYRTPADRREGNPRERPLYRA